MLPKQPITLVEGLLTQPHAPRTDRARGQLGAHEVEVRFVDRGVGSTREPVTEVCFLRAAVRTDLGLHVIAQRDADVAEAAAGRGTDVIVGDPAFDRAFFVEAGPRDVVVALFDAPLRAQMLATRPVAIHTRDEGLVVERAGWLDDREALRALLGLGAVLLERVPRAFEEADQRALARGGYRASLSPSARDELRRDEVADVLARKTEREERRHRLGCIGAGAFFVLVLVLSGLAATLASE